MSASDNVEWQLADLVDALSAEVDRAEDTLALKSYARKVSFAIKKMAMDIEVTMRRDPDGRLFFRTLEPGQTGDTLLKLDFSQVMENQLAGLRRPLDDSTSSMPVSILPGITADEVRAFNSIAIFTVDDFNRYTQTTAMIAEVSRKTGLSEVRLRTWRGMPFISAIKPASGAPGSSVVLEGGNFGLVPPDGTLILFHGHAAKILAWSMGRVTVETPVEALGPGLAFVVFGAQPTNVVAWEGTAMDLRVEDLVFDAEAPVSDAPFVVEAQLANHGSLATPSFMVQWRVDDKPLVDVAHGPLGPGQHSEENATRRSLLLKPGVHQVSFVADVNEELPGLDRALLSFTRQITVREPQTLWMADCRMLERMDPLKQGPVEGSHPLGLVFRGLASRNARGELVPELALGWTPAVPVSAGDSTLYSVTVTVRPEARFHDGSKVTVEDVRYSYQRMQQPDSPWSKSASHIRAMSVSETQVTFLLDAPEALLPMLTAGLVPKQAYEPDPDGFGQNPVGTGPFQVKSFTPEGLELSAFRTFFRGTPRLDRLSLALIPDPDRLGERIVQQEVQLAVMPYDENWFQTLSDLGEWALLRVKDSGQELLQVQSNRVLGHNLSDPDLNANAYLWYVKP